MRGVLNVGPSVGEIETFSFLAIVVVSVIVFCRPAHLVAQELSDEQARQLAISAVRQSRVVPESTFLNPHRLEDLEEAALSLQWNVRGRMPQKLYLVSISTEGYEIKGNEVFFHGSTGAGADRYVGIAAETSQTYRLYGFTDAMKDFNRMAVDLGFRIKDELTAERYALFAFRCVLGPKSNNIVYSELQVRHIAEDYFYAYNSPAEARRRFGSWWRGLRLGSVPKPLGPHAVKTHSGFTVELLLLDVAQGRPPKLQQYKIEMTTDGKTAIAETEPPTQRTDRPL